MTAGVAEAAGTAIAVGEGFHDLEAGLHHWHEYHLRNALAGLDREAILAAIPAGNEQLAMIIRVDEAGEIAQHDAMLVAQPEARQQHRRQLGVADVDGDAGGDELGLAGMDIQRLIHAGAQVHAGGTVSGVLRHGDFLADSVVEYFELDVHFLSFVHFVGFLFSLN